MGLVVLLLNAELFLIKIDLLAEEEDRLLLGGLSHLRKLSLEPKLGLLGLAELGVEHELFGQSLLELGPEIGDQGVLSSAELYGLLEGLKRVLLEHLSQIMTPLNRLHLLL